MSRWEAAFAASLAGTIPVLAFLFSFSTVAYGVGVGNLLLVVFMRGLNSRSWRDRGLGVLAAAAALGIYDTFLAALVALSLVIIYRRPRLSSIGLGLGMSALALALSRGIGLFVSWAVQAPQGSYLSRYIDVGGFFDDPVGRFYIALKNVIKVIFLSSERFGLHSPWLAVVLVVLAMAALINAFRSKGNARVKTIRFGALACLVLIPFGAEAISPGPVPMRSMLYLPIIVLVLTSIALRTIKSLPRQRRAIVSGVIAALIVLSVLGNATIANRLFAATGRTYALDQDLAFSIGQQKDRLLGGDNLTSLPLMMSGKHAWPDSVLTPTRETLGASFFEWNGGSAHRVVAFLLSQGVMVHSATPAEASSSWPILDGMPVYPQPGWITIHNGVLLLKFGDRTPGGYQ